MKKSMLLVGAMVMGIMAFAQDQTLMTINGKPISAEEFLYIYEKNNQENAGRRPKGQISCQRAQSRGCCAALALRAPVRSRALRGCSSYAECSRDYPIKRQSYTFILKTHLSVPTKVPILVLFLIFLKQTVSVLSSPVSLHHQMVIFLNKG